MRSDRRSRRWLCALVASLALSAGVFAPSALATTHDYCTWTGGTCANAAGTLYFASAAEPLTNNYAYLVFAPASPTIFCGAYSGGTQYAGYTSGNPSCSHAYSGANSLVADEYVSVAATTHGIITY